jgi:hypothetical protein
MGTFLELEINPQWVRDYESSLIDTGTTDQDIIDEANGTPKEGLKIDLSMALGLDEDYENKQGSTLDEYTDKYGYQMQRSLFYKYVLMKYTNAEICNEERIFHYTNEYEKTRKAWSGWSLPPTSTAVHSFSIMS